MEACRACLSNGENQVLFDDNLIHGYNLLTNLNIKPLDGLSQHICEICFNTVISFLNFREQCITSESTLQQKLSQTIKIEPQSIKSEPSEIETIVETDIPVKRKFGRPRKENSFKGKEGLGSLNKNDTTEPPIKRRVGRPSKTTRNAWVVRPRQNTITTGTVSNGCVERFDTILSKVECPRKDTSTTRKGQNWVICPRKTEDVIKSCALAIKKEIENPDGSSDNLDIEIDVNISNNLVKNEDLEDGISSKMIKPAEDEEDDDRDDKDKDYEDDTDEDAKDKDNKDEETSIPCGLCKKKLEDQKSLCTHLESHRSGTRCETCQETFVEWQALLAHRLVHVKSRKSHKCHICHKPQWSPLFFEYHYLCEHSDKNVQDVKMTCRICLKKYSDPKKMKRHWKNEHKDVRYTCDKCSKAFAYKYHLKLHEWKHFDEKPFACDMCDFQSKFKNSLRVHVLKKHTESSAYCTKCSRVFARKEYLERHVCADKVQVCPNCGIVTKCLKRHMRVHSDIRKFACTRCPATFKGKVALQVHMNKHDDLRPYGCGFCPKRFNSRTVLIKHRRVHTGEKPYVCKVCDKGFTGNHNLKVHMKVHGEDLVVKRNAVPVANYFDRLCTVDF